MAWPDMAARMLGVAVRTFSHATPDRVSDVVYMPRAGSPYPVSGVFNAAHVFADISGEVPISTVKPVLGVQLSEISGNVQKGDRVRVGSTVYVVDNFQKDGEAGALLVLYEA